MKKTMMTIGGREIRTITFDQTLIGSEDPSGANLIALEQKLGAKFSLTTRTGHLLMDIPKEGTDWKYNFILIPFKTDYNPLYFPSGLVFLGTTSIGDESGLDTHSVYQVLDPCPAVLEAIDLLLNWGKNGKKEIESRVSQLFLCLLHVEEEIQKGRFSDLLSLGQLGFAQNLLVITRDLTVRTLNTQTPRDLDAKCLLENNYTNNYETLVQWVEEYDPQSDKSGPENWGIPMGSIIGSA